MLLNERGGIIDDTVITKHADDAYYVVTNAGRRERDLAWFAAKLEEWNSSERASAGKVEHELLDGWGLLALQGASAVMTRGHALTRRRPGGCGLPAGADLVRPRGAPVRTERVRPDRRLQPARRAGRVHGRGRLRGVCLRACPRAAC